MSFFSFCCAFCSAFVPKIRRVAIQSHYSFACLCSVFVSKNTKIKYNRTTVLFVCVVRLYQKIRKFGTIALHKLENLGD
ncbi:hypothetical protein CJ214_06760 [Peptoniphilus lacrimalis]|nr:hypothetical protein CJ214_06760 [Peptoniphilus lacrimalis]